MKKVDPIVLALARRRTELGWTQLKVAMLLGHSTPTQVTEWESGRRCPSVANARRWADVLRCDIGVTVRRFDKVTQEWMRV